LLAALGGLAAQPDIQLLDSWKVMVLLTWWSK